MEKKFFKGKIVLNPQVKNGKDNNLDVLESIILAIEKDSALDLARQLASLNKTVSSCVRRPNEFMTSFIEQFVLPAQAYFNLTSSDQTSAAS